MTHSATSTIGKSAAQALNSPHTARSFGFLGLPRWFAERRKRSLVTAQLERLTDRELSDIGLLRADIPRVVRGEAPG